MKKLQINFYEIEYCNLLCCMLFGFRAYVGFFNGIVRSIVGNTYRLDTVFVYTVAALLVIKCLPAILHSIKFMDVALAVLFLFSFSFSSVFPNYNRGISVSVFSEILTKCLPLYIGARIASPTEKFRKYMRFTAYVIILFVFWKIFIGGSSRAGNTYDQYDGYLAYFGLCILAFSAFTQKKRMDFLGIALALAVILSSGARGPLLFGAGILVYYIVATDSISSRSMRCFIVGLILIFVVIFCLFAETILTALLGLLSMSGVASTRTLARLAGNNFLEDNSRTAIFAISIEYISNHLLFGTGIINDRSYLATIFTLKGDVIGTYSHNVVLEVCMQYGLILGLVLIVVAAAWIVKCYRSQKSLDERNLFISLAFCGLAPLAVSYSYLTFPMFSFFLGYLVNRTYCARRQSRYSPGNDLNRRNWHDPCFTDNA